MKKDYYSEYKNVKDYLDKNNYKYVGVVYKNILAKQKIYYTTEKTNHDSNRNMYLHRELTYGCLTLFGKLIALVSVIGIYLGLSILTVLLGLLTFRFKELFDKDNYQSDVAEDAWKEIFVGMKYSHKTIGSSFSRDIPDVVPVNQYKKYLRYKERLPLFYMRKSNAEKKIISKFLYGADYVALKHLGLLDDAWEAKGTKMLDKINKKD